MSPAQEVATIQQYKGEFMKTEISLLELDDEEMDGNISVILYGRTSDHKRVVVVDPTYEPYFYVLPKNPNQARKEVAATLKKSNMKVKRIEGVKKILLGEERDPELRHLHIELMTFVTEIRRGLVSVVTLSAINLPQMRVMRIRVEFICFIRHLRVISMTPQADRPRNILLRRAFHVAA